MPSRLSQYLDSMVDTTQSAFIKGRCIVDNIVAVNELIFSLQKGKSQGDIVKVDFAKVFDMVDLGIRTWAVVAKDLGPNG